ncbi:uncharacterized protein [Lolium perenne]|uniref:uncharacterized protein n=1 Tax=Lolium perenne TaxID=4522 RepID=UPI0021F616B0|nr:uncharacterized protein LOC127328963 [Lolium perenne]
MEVEEGIAQMRSIARTPQCTKATAHALQLLFCSSALSTPSLDVVHGTPRVDRPAGYKDDPETFCFAPTPLTSLRISEKPQDGACPHLALGHAHSRDAFAVVLAVVHVAVSPPSVPLPWFPLFYFLCHRLGALTLLLSCLEPAQNHLRHRRRRSIHVSHGTLAILATAMQPCMHVRGIRSDLLKHHDVTTAPPCVAFVVRRVHAASTDIAHPHPHSRSGESLCMHTSSIEPTLCGRPASLLLRQTTHGTLHEAGTVQFA